MSSAIIQISKMPLFGDDVSISDYLKAIFQYLKKINSYSHLTK